jgi:Flp pilus assembly protein TadG
VRDISARGLYLLTEQRWYPGTVVVMSLQREDLATSDPLRTISITAMVIRSGEDGVGFSFVMDKDNYANRTDLSAGTDKRTFERFLRQFKEDHGQALIEYVMMLPLLFLLILNLINFAGFFYAWIGVANASRAGADYAALGGASTGSLGQATSSQLSTMISEDIMALPNSGSITVQICQNVNGTITTIYGATCPTTAPAGTTDPEPTSYVVRWVDVTYNYTPFVGAGFRFPNLNVNLTIPPTTITRRSIIRAIQ